MRYRWLFPSLLFALPAYALQGPGPGAMEPGSIALPSGPASLQGLDLGPEADGFSGQLTHSFPLNLPAGPGGFGPQLILQYSSGGGAGLLGMGWSFGVPEIRRDHRHDALDLVGPGLASGRLVMTDEGVLRPRNQGYKASVQASGGGFIARNEQGWRYAFGINANHRIGHGERVDRWLLSTITDAAGQEVTFRYDLDGDQAYVRSISWGKSGYFALEFHWADRPDVRRRWINGRLEETRWRLAVIMLQAGGQRRSKWRLGYEVGPGKSLLTSIQTLGTDDDSSLPAQTFSYRRPAEPRTIKFRGTLPWPLSHSDASLLDVDGDGLPDLVKLDDSPQWARNEGDGFAAPEPLRGGPSRTLSGGALRIMDTDGDARPELMDGLSGGAIFRLVGNEFEAAGHWRIPPGLSLVAPGQTLADLNSDGQPDLLAPAGGQVRLYWGSDGGLQPAELMTLPGEAGQLAPGHARVRFSDLSGDGVADLVVLHSTFLMLSEGRGDGSFTQPSRRELPFSISDYSAVRLVDLDRDGIADVVHVSTQQIVWARGQLGGTYAEGQPQDRPDVSVQGLTVQLADLNGNGSQDLIWSRGSELWVVDLAGGVGAGLLTGIDNGMGRRTEVHYATTAHVAQEDARRGKEWARFLPSCMPIPIALTQIHGDGTPNQVQRLAVRDPFWDGEERSFGGFLASTTVAVGADDAGTLYTRSSYYPGVGVNRARRGKVWRAQREDGNGQVFDISDQDWRLRELPGLGASTELRVAEKISETFEVREGLEQGLTSRVEWAYDDEGNTVLERFLGRLDVTGDEYEEHRLFISGRAHGLYGRLEESWRLAQGRRSDHFRYFYDGAEEPLALGSVTAGRLRRKEGYLVEEDRWLRIEATDYDAVGNPVMSWEQGVRRVTEYGAYGLYPVAEHVEVKPGEVLSVAATWDGRIGKPTGWSLYDGVRHEARYDGLARTVALGLAGKAPDKAFSYRWLAPLPCTVTVRHEGTIGDLEDWSCVNGGGQPRFSAKAGGAGRWLIRDETHYDVRGNSRGICEPRTVSGDTPEAAVRDGKGVCEQAVFDATGRMLQRTDLRGSVWAHQYAPFSSTFLAPEMAATVLERDGLGRPWVRTRTIGGQEEHAQAAYDGGGRLTAIVLQRAVTHQFGYDSLGRLVTVNDPDQGERRNRYNDAGTVAQTVNAAGQQVDFTYDGAGRVLAAVGSAGSSMRYHYDRAHPEAPPDLTNLAGRLAFVEEPTGRVEFGYDDHGHQSVMSRVVDGQRGTERNVLSPAGRLLQRSWDGGPVVDLEYDTSGRLTTMGSLYSVTERDEAGRIVERGFGNGLQEHFELGPGGVTVAWSLSGPGGPIRQLTYRRNALAAPVQILGGEEPMSFEYDDAFRLAKAELHGRTFSYEYDALQNMVRRTVSGAEVPGLVTGAFRYGSETDGPRRLVSAGNQSLEHDSAGRATSIAGKKLTWDAFDRLVKAQTPEGEELEYAYGLAGLRTLRRSSEGGTTRWFSPDHERRDGHDFFYLSSGGRQVVRISQPVVDEGSGCSALGGEENSGAALLGVLVFLILISPMGRRRKLHVTVGLLLLVQVKGCAGCGGPIIDDVLYFHRSFTPGPDVISDDRGDVVESRRFSPFGHPLDADLERESLSHGNAKADPTTGWSDHGARWLAADLGRWLAPDPPLDQPDAEAMMGQPGKLNPYVALSNNPIVLEDPDGAEPITLIVIGAATGAVAVYSWVKAGIYATNEQAALKSNTRQDLYDTGVVAAKAGVAAAAGTVGVAWAVGAGVALEGGEQLILEVTDDVEGISAGRVMLKTVGGAMGGLLGGLAGTLKQQGVGRKARYFIELAVGTKLGGTRDFALVQITKGQAHAIQRKDERQRLSELEQWENGGGSCTPTDEGAALCV